MATSRHAPPHITFVRLARTPIFCTTFSGLKVRVQRCASTAATPCTVDLRSIVRSQLEIEERLPMDSTAPQSSRQKVGAGEARSMSWKRKGFAEESRACAPRAHPDDRRRSNQALSIRQFPPCQTCRYGDDVTEAAEGLCTLGTIDPALGPERRGEYHRNKVIPRDCEGPHGGRNSHHDAIGAEVTQNRLCTLNRNRVFAAVTRKQTLP